MIIELAAGGNGTESNKLVRGDCFCLHPRVLKKGVCCFKCEALQGLQFDDRGLQQQQLLYYNDTFMCLKGLHGKVCICSEMAAS